MNYLKPGDLVRDKDMVGDGCTGIGMVMRHDEDGLLIAIPGMEEITVADSETCEWIGVSISVVDERIGA